jgi:hypothetical protein
MMNQTNMMNMTNMLNMMNMTNMTYLPDNSRSGYSCNVNNWDGYQYCKCKPGQKISKFESYHHNHYEDRKWYLQCSDNGIAINPSHRYRTGFNNWWDGVFYWGGSGNDWCYMVGMRSYHDNFREDRRYDVYYSCSRKWTLTYCSGWQWLNNWDGGVKRVLESKQVITGLYSYHDNNKEDRRFAIMVCELVPKCDQLVEMTYDYGKMTMTEKEETAGKGTLDNRGSKSQNSVTAKISWSEQTRLADAYTFSRTSGWSTTGSLSVTLGYNWGASLAGISAGGSVSVTAGFSATFETSETWTRSQTKTYVETHSEGVASLQTVSLDASARCLSQRLMARPIFHTQ